VCDDETNIGTTWKGDKERFLSAGFDDYIPKPLDIPEFIKKIEKYIKLAISTENP